MVVMVEIGEESARSVCMDVGPIIVALDTNDPASGELIIAAELAATECAAGIATKRPTAEPSQIWRFELLLDPGAADVAADIAAGPAEEVDWRRSLVDRCSAEVGCAG